MSELVAASLYRAEMEQAQRVKPQMPLLSLKALTSRVGNVVGLTPLYVSRPAWTSLTLCHSLVHLYVTR